MNALLQRLGNWLDERTGWQDALHHVLYENVPGGSRWIYVTGSMLALAFVTQVITGIFLWMFYSPGSQNAWESVYWIQNVIQGGWFLRGVHHYMSHAMVVLLPVHLLQVVLYKAYVKPREMNYWLGLVLMLLVLALGLTGYLLPWDQKGYWATKVATELVSLSPIAGEQLQKLVVGGSEYGHYTLTRFFALHAGVLPSLLVLVLVLHVTLFRKHGITAKSSETRPDESFWPKQVFKDTVACLLMILAVVIVVWYKHGAELGPPAEPMQSYGAARPEWYYLFLFQLLKKFPNEFIGAIVVPSLVMLFLFLMPLWAGRWRWAHVINVVVLLVLVGGAAFLTKEAITHDQYASQNLKMPEDAKLRLEHFEREQASRRFLSAKWLAEKEYERVRELVEYFGIPSEGAAAGLVANDPEIQGPRLFSRHCASCHSWLNPQGPDPKVHGVLGPFEPRDSDRQLEQNPGAYAAPNLYHFGSREWLGRVLDPEEIAGPEMFGYTAHGEAEMVTFVKDELAELDDGQRRVREAIIAAVSAEAELVYQADVDQTASDGGILQQGRDALGEAIDSSACLDCHKFYGQGEESAPDLTGYASREWLYAFIANPRHARFYGDSNDRMPSFLMHIDVPDQNRLTASELDLLVRWLRHDDEQLGQPTVDEPESPSK